jgi:drug/metabolite transporter (DMT)-like permease
MDFLSALLLFTSVIFSSGRNLLSKGISSVSFGSRRFFLLQSLIFSSGALVLLIFTGYSFKTISFLTVLFSVVYAVLLLSAQWCYTIALRSGQVGVCATVYSLGFILPTISGAIFWHETVTLWNVIGVSLIIPIMLLSGKEGRKEKVQENRHFIFPLLIAMISSGGLGIMQKVQQNSAYPEEKSVFVFVSFLLTATISFVCFLTRNKEEEKVLKKQYVFSCGAGSCFAICNLLNTSLAGMLSSAVLFPILNIGSIFLSALLSVLLFREHLSTKHYLILLLGTVSILLIALF